jgi:hypothetical protein
LSSAFSSFDFVLLCDQRNGGEDPKISKNKIKTGAILKRDDQVITLLFQCLLVGLFSQQKNRKKKIQPTF